MVICFIIMCECGFKHSIYVDLCSRYNFSQGLTGLGRKLYPCVAVLRCVCCSLWYLRVDVYICYIHFSDNFYFTCCYVFFLCFTECCFMFFFGSVWTYKFSGSSYPLSVALLLMLLYVVSPSLGTFEFSSMCCTPFEFLLCFGCTILYCGQPLL